MKGHPMTSSRFKLPVDRAAQHKRNKTAAQRTETYTTSTGVKRIRILHPTKGWRDRNEELLLNSRVQFVRG